MTKLVWDAAGQRLFETGVDRGVFYVANANGVYDIGYAWNGLTGITESPSGAESTPLYADNMKYVNMVSVEEFGATLEAFMYPKEFAPFDGLAEPVPGVFVGQQSRKAFGLSYRTRIGNDIDGSDHGYKIHLIYGATAAPSEKAYNTINDSPEAATLSWDLKTTPVDAGSGLRPTAQLTIDSTKVAPAALANLENILYGTAGTDPRLPLPAEVYGMFGVSLTTVTPTEPTKVGNNITIPTVAGVEYTIDDVVVTGVVTITEDTIVVARPFAGYAFPEVVDTDWLFTFA